MEFQFKVQGKEELLYQWLKDGVELPEQNDTSLILERIKLRDFGWYKCRVRYQDSFGIAIESSRAWLDVIPQIQNGTSKYCLHRLNLRRPLFLCALDRMHALWTIIKLSETNTPFTPKLNHVFFIKVA